MGAALAPSLTDGEACLTQRVNRGRTVANLESRLFLGDTMVAMANGNYAIFTPRT